MKLDKMPPQYIIDGFKGVIDFYYWKGIPCARKWPVWRARQPTPDEASNQEDFAYINKLWRTLPANLIEAYNAWATPTTLTGKDWFVRAYMKGWCEPMPPTVPDHNHQDDLTGGQLTAAIIDTFLDFLEQAAAPANPPANSARLYAREDTGVTKLYYKQDNGTEIEIGAPPIPTLGGEVERLAAQAIPDITGTAIVWDAEIRDDNAFWSVANPTRITIPATGWYTLSAIVDWADVAIGKRNSDWRLNGVTFRTGQSHTAVGVGDVHQSFTFIHYFTAAEWVEVLLWHNRGAPLNIDFAQLGILQMP